MRLSPRTTRVATVLAIAALAASVSSCSMFGKKSDLYAQSGETRPLEVPPDLDRPSTDRAMALPDTSSVSASGMNKAGGSSAAPVGFNATGERDAVFARVGDVLAATDGVTIASKAQILGTYDVSYMGSDFLVRVTKVGNGTYISAVDPRGLPPTGDAPAKLIGALKTAIAP
ncbi:MAG: hypothetical protein ACOH1L_08485 [Thermomonas sp.]